MLTPFFFSFNGKDYILLPEEGLVFTSREEYDDFLLQCDKMDEIIDEFMTQWEWDYQNKKWNKRKIWEDKPIPQHELLKIFPEAKTIVRQQCTEKIHYLEAALTKLINEDRGVMVKIGKARTDADRTFFQGVRERIADQRKSWQQDIIRARWKIADIDGKIPQHSDNITPDHIRTAKEKPMSTLYTEPTRRSGRVEYGRCPFHKDDKPSFAIYVDENRWWCYGCSFGGDTIDFIIKRDGCNFIEAVKKLL